MHHSDITIIGGGLTGGLAALALASKGFSITVIEGQAPEKIMNDAYDGRTTAIAYASMRLFRKLGLWDAIAHVCEPIKDILVTDGKKKSRFSEGGISSFHMHFDSSSLNSTSTKSKEDENRPTPISTPLGWIVENATLRTVLFKAITAHENIHLHAPARRTHTNFSPANCVTRFTDKNGDEQSVTSALTLAADGKSSQLRAQAGIKVNHWKYAQTGFVATIAHQDPHEGFAQEYFLPGGPFAILPMTDKTMTDKMLADNLAMPPPQHRSSLVWTEKDKVAKNLASLNDDAFLEELKNRFGPYLGEISLAGPRFSYPLSFHLSHDYIAPRLALIGDAARAIHPIAGQGFNLGIKDIAAITDVLDKGRSVGLDIGNMNVLDEYQRWRRFDSVSLALGTDILNRFFSTDVTLIRKIRTIGLGLVNAAAPLRQFFMKQAGADVGTLPSLLRDDR